MEPKRPLFGSVRTAGTVLALALFGALAAASSAQIADTPPRISFQISTGSTSGNYLTVGVLLGQLLSHPPGVGRCEAANVCGPAGLIITTRSSEGSTANVSAVDAGSVNSGLAQSDVVELAVAGEGPYRKSGPAKQLRVITSLFAEDVQLVAAKSANIKSVADLRGKRVSLNAEGSGSITTARAVLAAYRLTERNIVANHDKPDQALELLRDGKLDAMFIVGNAPMSLVAPLFAEDVAVLVPINGEGRQRLRDRQPSFSEHVIAANTYPGIGAVDTVSVSTLWITDASQPDALIYGMVKALYNPVHRPAIEAQRLNPNFLDPSSAVKGVETLLHPGAARFFAETGLLKPEQKAQPAAPAVAPAAPTER